VYEIYKENVIHKTCTKGWVGFSVH